MTLNELGHALASLSDNIGLWLQSWSYNIKNNWGELTIGQACITIIILFVLYKIAAMTASGMWESFIGRMDFKRQAAIERHRTQELQKPLTQGNPRGVWVLIFVLLFILCFVFLAPYFSEDGIRLRETLELNKEIEKKRGLEDIFRSNNIGGR